MDKQLNAVYIDLKEECPAGLIAQLSEVDWVCIDNIEDASDTQQQPISVFLFLFCNTEY
jgi:DnaA family protein